MQKLKFGLFVLFVACQSVNNSNPCGPEITQTVSAYQQEIKNDPFKKLINLMDHIPDIVIEIRYATTNNFTAEEVYDYPAALVRKHVAEFGFSVYPSEWWHFDYKGWERFGLMDLKIRDLVDAKE